MVTWLENQKIRHYTIPQRQGLLATSADDWRAAYGQYLTALECPCSSEGLPATLQWLCSRAVSLEYADRNEQLNASTSAAVEVGGAVSDWSEHSLPPFADTASPAVAAAVMRMLRTLHMDQEEVTPSTVERLSSVLDTQVLPALPGDEDTAAPSGTGRQGVSAAGPIALLAGFPLGFSTGSPLSDAAATILRMLYLRDLRGLQDVVDRELERVQASTVGAMADKAYGRPAR